MIILKEATLLGSDPFFYTGSEGKDGYEYCSLYPSYKEHFYDPRSYYGRHELPYYFSFNQKTGLIDLSGYPWNFIQDDLKKDPYPPALVAFLKKEIPNIAKALKGGSNTYYVNGSWTNKEPKYKFYELDPQIFIPKEVIEEIDKKGNTHYYKNIDVYPSRKILLGYEKFGRDYRWDPDHIFSYGQSITIEIFPGKDDIVFNPRSYSKCCDLGKFGKGYIAELLPYAKTIGKYVWEDKFDLYWNGSKWVPA